MQVGRWSSRDGVVMDPRKPVYWLSGSVAVPKDSSAVVENTTIRVVTVIVSIRQFCYFHFVYVFLIALFVVSNPFSFYASLEICKYHSLVVLNLVTSRLDVTVHNETQFQWLQPSYYTHQHREFPHYPNYSLS